MSSGAAPGDANVSNDAADSSARSQYARTLIPNLVQLIKEMLVVFKISHLTWGGPIFLESPVGWRCHDEMDRLVLYPG
jgi:hypothetical protein